MARRTAETAPCWTTVSTQAKLSRQRRATLSVRETSRSTGSMDRGQAENRQWSSATGTPPASGLGVIRFLEERISPSLAATKPYARDIAVMGPEVGFPPGKSQIAGYVCQRPTDNAGSAIPVRGVLRGASPAAVAIMLYALLPVIAHGAADTVELTPSDPPTAETILEDTLDRAEARDEAGVELGFESIVLSTVETIGPEGEVAETETRRSHRYPLEGELYQELVEVDGASLSPSQTRNEARKKEAFVKSARRRAARGVARDPKERRMRFGRELMGRYKTVIAGSESVRGDECWVLAFDPREGSLPSSSAMDRALNQSSGRLWIRKDDHDLARMEFEMRNPIRYLWGLFATLRQAAGEIDFKEVEPGIWLPSRFQIELDLRLLAGVKAIRKRIRIQWVDYRRVRPDARTDGAGGS